MIMISQQEPSLKQSSSVFFFIYMLLLVVYLSLSIFLLFDACLFCTYFHRSEEKVEITQPAADVEVDFF